MRTNLLLRLALGSLPCLGFGACGAVKVNLESEPTAALVHIDGNPMARTPYEFPAPYYGMIDVYASLPPDGATSYLPAHTLVSVPLPAPRTFFPFDLLFEGAHRLLGIQPQPKIHLKLKRVKIPTSKLSEPGAESRNDETKDEEALIQRAKQDALRR